MFIDPDLRAMIVARFDFVGTELTPGVPDTVAGRAAARSSVLRELVRLVYDRVKFSDEGSADERSSLALVVDEAEDHWQRMHAAAFDLPPPSAATPLADQLGVDQGGIGSIGHPSVSVEATQHDLVQNVIGSSAAQTYPGRGGSTSSSSARSIASREVCCGPVDVRSEQANETSGAGHAADVQSTRPGDSHPAGLTSTGRIDLLRVTTAVRHLVGSVEPARIFSQLAQVCVPAICDACTIDLVEGAGHHYRIRQPAETPWTGEELGHGLGHSGGVLLRRSRRPTVLRSSGLHVA